MGLFDALKRGLRKTREGSMGAVDEIFLQYGEISDDFYDELEEALILADLGMTTSMDIVARVREKAEERKLKYTKQVYDVFIEEIKRILYTSKPKAVIDKMTNVLLVIGVNGAGKTTTIGKLAYQLKEEGHGEVESEGWLVAYDWNTKQEVSREMINHDTYRPGISVYWRGVHDAAGNVVAG